MEPRGEKAETLAMLCIHFLCRDRLNVHAVKHPVYESGDWDVSKEDAERLVGGMIFLHQAKAQTSYVGGRIESFREIDTEMAHSRRVVFKFTSLAEGKGVRWQGADHSMAWTSGVVECGN